MTTIQVITIVVSLLLIFGWCEYTRVDELARARAIGRNIISSMYIIHDFTSEYKQNKREG